MAYDRDRIIAIASTDLPHGENVPRTMWDAFIKEVAFCTDFNEDVVISRVVNLAEQYLCLPRTPFPPFPPPRTASGLMHGTYGNFYGSNSVTNPQPKTVPPPRKAVSPRRTTGRKFKP